ncbi:MAG: tRNA (adenosine(37)-N6)-dimethylallyltransferase MiaA [Candidatus Puniceispirillales bacterium]
MSSLLNVEKLFDLSKNNYSFANDMIIIAGPTGVGKSKIAIELAKKINGVLINADSVQVYKDLFLLSARPSKLDIQQVSHFLYGYVNSEINYSVVDWLLKLEKTLIDIELKNKIPILVGGSGLYINAVINGLVNIPVVSQKIKNESLSTFNDVGIEKFRQINFKIDPGFVQNNYDKHRLLRAYSIFLETKKNISFWHKQPRVKSVNKNIYSFFTKSERKLIYKKCEIRFDNMLAKGAVEEVKKLHYLNIDRSLPISKSLGVKWLLNYLDNKISFEEAVILSKRDTRRYVKRQFTWFNHNYIPYKTLILE